MERCIEYKPGDILQHFKRDEVNQEDKNKYLYKVLAIAQHTETKEPMLVYQALYGSFGVYVRPLAMAQEAVDYEHYSDVLKDRSQDRQKYRLEVIQNADGLTVFKGGIV